MHKFIATTVAAAAFLTVGLGGSPAGAGSTGSKCPAEAAAVAADVAAKAPAQKDLANARSAYHTAEKQVKSDVHALVVDIKAKNKSAIGPDKERIATDQKAKKDAEKAMHTAAHQLGVLRAKAKQDRAALRACLHAK